MRSRSDLVIIKSAGEMASGVAAILFQAGFKRILMLETPSPLAVRRTVSFCEAVTDGTVEVEGIAAVRADTPHAIASVWEQGALAVAVDPAWKLIEQMSPDVVIDAILAKKNLGTNQHEASLVIGLGPGFTAGVDVHYVIETNRGYHLGRVFDKGVAEANTGIPGNIGGYTKERVLRAPCAGVVNVCRDIGSLVEKGEVILRVDGQDVTASISGVVRGCIREGTLVHAGCKVGDVDPRGELSYCTTFSEKARIIGMAVLLAIARHNGI